MAGPPDASTVAVATRRPFPKLERVLLAIGAILAGLILLRQGTLMAPGEWQVGQVVDVEITLMAADARNLACAASEEVAGRHCAFEASSKSWGNGDSTDDKGVLKPYTTTARVALLAGGMWNEPALQGELPATRFSVKCRYTVEGKLKKPSIRWAPGGPWLKQQNDWNSGVVSNCTLVLDGGA